jgi:hypothetical protein
MLLASPMHLGRRHGEGRPRQLLWLLLRPLLLETLISERVVVLGSVSYKSAVSGNRGTAVTGEQRIMSKERAAVRAYTVQYGR